MIGYTVYKRDSGEIVLTGTIQDKQSIAPLITEGLDVIYELSVANNYVDNGKLVTFPPKPSENHSFDYQIKDWVFDHELAARKVLYLRDQLLKEGPDRINPLWWGSMTQDQQNAWSVYRQDLLDVTNQPGYPVSVNWPIKPE
jgi:Phage tail assembly chaperone protein